MLRVLLPELDGWNARRRAAAADATRTPVSARCVRCRRPRRAPSTSTTCTRAHRRAGRARSRALGRGGRRRRAAITARPSTASRRWRATRPRELPVTDELARTTLALPMGPELTRRAGRRRSSTRCRARVAGVSDALGVAVVGLGYWGPNLARNFDALPDAELRWICDASDEQRERVRARASPVRAPPARSTSCSPTPSWTPWRSRRRCRPTPTLAPRAARRRASTCFVEKPLAQSVGRCRAGRGRRARAPGAP